MTQIRQHPTAHHPESIVPAVGVEIGAKFGHQRKIQPPSRPQRGPTQRPFSGDVNEVGSLTTPRLFQESNGRKTHAKSRIARDGHPSGQPFRKAGKGGNGIRGTPGGRIRPVDGALRPRTIDSGLQRPSQFDGMPPKPETFNQLGDGRRDAVDLRRVGLRHQSDPKDLLRLGNG
jgi:hypothetical protein